MESYLDRALNMLKDAKDKRLLLHSCCAPCSSSVLELLTPVTDVTVFYYNPCIMPEEEYFKRLFEQRRLCKALEVPLVEGKYDNDQYLKIVSGLESAPEGGARCGECFFMRLSGTAEKAKEGGYDFFCTTLTVSPHKNAEVINSIGREVSIKYGVEFVPSDFKKRNGFLRSIELSKKYGLYRQEYCGCRF